MPGVHNGINLTRISRVRFFGVGDCPRRLCKSLA
jgi:hypothetical protein